MEKPQRIIEITDNKEELTERLTDALYREDTGYTVWIEVAEGGTEHGFDYGPQVVEIVVLSHDGSRVAYRFSSDEQDEDWRIGDINDAVEEALTWFETIEN